MVGRAEVPNSELLGWSGCRPRPGASALLSLVQAYELFMETAVKRMAMSLYSRPLGGSSLQTLVQCMGFA
jgi:hypothetical protein